MHVQQIDAVAELQRAVGVLFKNWVLAFPTMLVSLLQGFAVLTLT